MVRTPSSRAAVLLAAAAAALVAAIGVVSAPALANVAPPALGFPPAPTPEREPTQAAAPEPTHAERLALYQARVAAFRLIEPRLFGLNPAIARRRASAASPLTLAQLRAAMGKTDAECLAQAVYYEARSEPETGQAAVAQVVLNRARSGLYPSSVCGVVFQGAERRGCQFSFACDGALRRGTSDAGAWTWAQRIAATSLGGAGAAPEVASALNYHADYVKPGWAQSLMRVAEIGRHIFYQARAGL